MFSKIGAEIAKQCDSIDGVVDGIISSLELCNFTLSHLLCNGIAICWLCPNLFDGKASYDGFQLLRGLHRGGGSHFPAWN